MMQSVKATEEAAREVKESAQQIESFTKKLTGYADTAERALGALALSANINQAIELAGVQAGAERRLRTELEINGRAVGELQQQYLDYASALQDVTTVGDEVSIGLFRQAESLGLTGGVAEQAVQNAIGLASQNQMGLESALALTAELERGNSEGLVPYIQSLRYMTNEGQRWATAQQALQVMFRQETEAAQTFGGQVQQLRNSIGDLFEAFGRPAGELLRPMVDGFRTVVRWVQSLSEETKTTILRVAMLGAGFLSLRTAMPALTAGVRLFLGPLRSLAGMTTPLLSLAGMFRSIGAAVVGLPGILRTVSGLVLGMLNPVRMLMGLWTGIQAIFGLLTSPLTLILVPLLALTAATYAWVESAGGVANAWEIVKEKAQEFWVWIRPVVGALGFLFQTVGEVAMEAFRQFGAFVMGLFSDVADSANINWTDIRDGLLKAVIAMEYGIKNWTDVVYLSWVWLKLQFASYVVSPLTHLFGTVIPYLLGYFSRNWQQVFQTAFNYVRAVFTNMGTAIGDFFRDPTRFNWNTFIQGAQNAVQEAFVIPPYVMTQFEQQIRDEFNNLSGQMQQSWEEFRRMRLEQLANMYRDTQSQRQEDEGDLQRHNRWVKLQYEEANAAVLGSSEALARILRYRDTVLNPRSQVRTGVGQTPQINQAVQAAGQIQQQEPVLAGAEEEAAGGILGGLGEAIPLANQAAQAVPEPPANAAVEQLQGLPATGAAINGLLGGLAANTAVTQMAFDAFMNPGNPVNLQAQLGGPIKQAAPTVGDLMQNPTAEMQTAFQAYQQGVAAGASIVFEPGNTTPTIVPASTPAPVQTPVPAAPGGGNQSEAVSVLKQILGALQVAAQQPPIQVQEVTS